MSVFNIKINNDLKMDELISSPKGVAIVIAELYLFNSEFNSIKDCLIYRLPDEANNGELKVITVLPNDNCQKFILTKGAYAKLSIHNFSFNYIKSRRKLILNIDTEHLKYSFINMLVARKYQRYESSFSHFGKTGIQLSSVFKEKGEVILKNGDICFDTGDKCEKVKTDLCHLCPHGVIEVKASHCATSYRKYCSKDNCGSKGQYACLRGHMASGYNENYCINGSPIGYCQKGFSVLCVDDELICL